MVAYFQCGKNIENSSNQIILPAELAYYPDNAEFFIRYDVYQFLYGNFATLLIIIYGVTFAARKQTITEKMFIISIFL